MQLDTHIKRNNCKTKIKDKRGFLRFDNITYDACYCNFYNPQILTLVSISNNLKKFGTLPQYLTEKTLISNKLYQAHNIIQTYFFEIEKIEVEKMKQKVKGK